MAILKIKTQATKGLFWRGVRCKSSPSTPPPPQIDDHEMEMLSIKVSIPEKGLTKTMQFGPQTKNREVCQAIRDKLQEVPLGSEKDYGLFFSDEDQKKGVWLEMDRDLEYYLLRSGDTLVYKRKMRKLKVKMLDNSVKTLMVDDSQPVANLMVLICTKIGITNHDEYSLVRETPEEINKEPSYGTLTLRRDKKDKNKMEQLKKKLKTDDDLNWVDHSKTLREQDIDEDENLLLRRKYFFSDHNVDSRDPIQLNLLYVQARDAIINGAHPVTVEQALQFGGMQVQIQFGDHNETKHKPGLLDLKDFLPKDFYKNKGMAKKLFAEHKKYSGLSELETKAQYVSLARSLKTYGVTFFLVKEKQKNKNKLVPRLLGVTKDSVLRLDEKTKEIIKTWPLTTVRRWAASPNSFTLDFGDYQDSYYSVQTTEGEQISQLIAGYIDIIIKKQRSHDHMGIEGDEGSTMVEDNVTPAKATFLQQNPGARLSQISTGSIALPAVLRVGANGAQIPGLGQVQPAQFGDLKNQAHSIHSPITPQQVVQSEGAELSEPQRAYLGVIDSGHQAVESAQQELLEGSKPELGAEQNSLQWRENTLDVKRQTVSSQIAAMNAATAQVITYTSVPPEEIDHPAVGAAISTIATNLPEMSKDVKVMAALMEDTGGQTLLEAARGLCSAFSELLRAAEGPATQSGRQGLLAAAGRVGEASHAVLHSIGEEPIGSQEVVMGLAKAVANAASYLMLAAKSAASYSPDPPAVIHAATQCALITSQLVACAKVIAPSVGDATCRQQLVSAAREVAHEVEEVMAACRTVEKGEEVLAAGAQVGATLQALQDHLAALSAWPGSPQEDAVDRILATSSRLVSAAGDTSEMVRQARILTKATSELINSINGDAEHMADDEMRSRILSATKVLAGAMARMIEAAKGCSNNPQDTECQKALCRAVEEVRLATSNAASGPLKRKLVRKLESAAKEACSAASQTIAAAKGASAHNSSDASREELWEACTEVASHIPRVIQGVKATMADVDSSAGQLALIKSSQAILQPCQLMLEAARGSLATVNSPAHRLHMGNVCSVLEQRLAELRDALGRVQSASGVLGLEKALEAIREISQQLEEWQAQAGQGQLAPLGGDTPESTAVKMGAACRSVGASTSQLLTAANQGQDSLTGAAARDTAQHLRELAEACRAVAAETKDPVALEKALKTMVHCTEMVMATGAALEQWPRECPALSVVARSVSTALSDCMACLPAHRELDCSLATVAQSSQLLASPKFPPSNKPYSELQASLNSAAADLNTSAAKLVEDAPTGRLAQSAQHFGHSYTQLLDCGLEMAGSTTSQEVQGQVVVSLRDVSLVSSKLLSTAKLTASDPTSPAPRSQLAAAARAVTDAINRLVDVCTSAAPGQKDCDNAIRKIQSMRPLLDSLVEPASEAGYFECLDTVVEQSKVLGEAMSKIVSSRDQPEPLAQAVKTMAAAICELIEAGAQAGYLVGVWEEGSVPGRQGLVDPAQFARSRQAIEEACHQLASSSGTPEINAASAIIARHTSLLCTSCRSAAPRSADPTAKCHLVLLAKEIAIATANLVTIIKALNQDFSDLNRQNYQEATRFLLEAIDNLIAYSSSSEFATVPAQLSVKALQDQQPIVEAGRTIIDGSCNLLSAAKNLATDPQEPRSWKALSDNSKKISDAIITLVASIKDHAPGQKECDAAIARLGQAMQLLGQQAPCINGGPSQPLRSPVEAACAELLNQAVALSRAAKLEPHNLATTVKKLAEQAEPLAKGTSQLAQTTDLPLADLSRAVLESALRLVVVAKETGGNPRSSHLHPELDKALAAIQDTLKKLKAALNQLENSAKQAEELSQAIAAVDLADKSNRRSFTELEASMEAAAKEVARLAQEMAAKAVHSPNELEPLAAQLCSHFSQLASSVPACVASCQPSPELGEKIRDSVRDLGQSCRELAQAARRHLSSPTPYSGQAVGEVGRTTAEQASAVLAALAAASRGLQACDSATSTVSGIIGDLDTTILFATAGTLHPDSREEVFEEHRMAIIQTAQAMMEDTKKLVAGAHAGQESLAVAAQGAVATVVQLTEAVKLGAASLGAQNPQSQVLLINAVRDVAFSLSDLLQATKCAAAAQCGPNAHAASVQLTGQAKMSEWLAASLHQEEELVGSLVDTLV